MGKVMDGAVVASAQEAVRLFEKGESTLPMVGVILSVRPSDNHNNTSASGNSLFRGCRHECVVLASTDLGQPTTRLDNVIIPPFCHSGIDNYEENLPRGCSGMAVNGETYNTDLTNIDLTQLDGEWCVVGFVGGKVYQPFLQCWWPHPFNAFDPATSGETPPIDNAKAWLVQYDLKQNRGRKLWRNNGTLFLLNREGSIYLDTTQANRKVSLDKSYKQQVSQSGKGGHTQLDIKTSAQLEINWNEKKVTGPQIGAGSSFQTTVAGETVGSTPQAVFESDFPQDQPTATSTPKATPRATTRTIIQGKEYEVILKTSKLILAGQAGGNYAGELDLFADALIKLKAGTDVSVEAPLIHLGGSAAVQPLVLGTQWVSVMTQLLSVLQTFMTNVGMGPMLAPTVAAISAQIASGLQLSKAVFTK